MSTSKSADRILIERFVESFGRLDDLSAVQGTNPVRWQLSVGEPGRYGAKTWRPLKSDTPPEALEPIYQKLPAGFPQLYEQLILSYRWAEVDLKTYRLLANPPGTDLSGLFAEMSKDQHLWASLIPAGFLRFAMGPDVDYDPVCFDVGSRKKKRDCRIVKIDHEQILCYGKVKVVAELAPTFKDLMVRTIESANRSN